MAKSEALQIQELANNSALKIQKLVDATNKEMMKFNKAEASTAREFNSKQSELERTFNASEAEKARKWQETMSNTSHQREVKDLKKAGLNPVLSANSGAQSYITSSASAGSASANNASASLDSGAGAFGSVMSGLIGSLTNLTTSKMSADAQLRSAKLSSDASRYASDISRQNAITSAQAQKYSSDRALQASKYSADKSYEASKYMSDRQFELAMKKPQTNVVGLIDKYLGNRYGEKAISQAENAAKSMQFKYQKWKDGDYHYSPVRSKKVESAMNKVGINQYYLNHLSEPQREKVYQRFYNAFAKKNKADLKYFRK